MLTEVVPNAEITKYDLGASRWHATGELLPESVLNELRQHDAILLAPSVIGVCPAASWSAVCCCVALRLDHHVNLRPGRLYPGVRSRSPRREVDMVVVQEAPRAVRG